MRDSARSPARPVVALAVLALALLAAAALAEPSHVVQALDPSADETRATQLRDGARLLRGLLLLHGVVCAVASGLLARRRDARTRGTAPLWSPARAPGAVGGGEAGLLIAALGLAALARAIALDGPMWMDEVFTLTEFVRLPAGRIATSFPHDNQHLLYSLFARASCAALGESPAALRLPAVVFGLASLVATWRLGRLVLGAPTGVAAAWLLALSYHHVWFSQNARGYTGLLFATLVATELFLRGLWRGRGATWLAYAASVALGMSVHLTMVFVPLAHAIVGVVFPLRAAGARESREGPSARSVPRRGRPFPRDDVLALTGALALAASLTLLLHALVLPQIFTFFTRPGAGSTTAAVEWKQPLWLLRETLRGLGLGMAAGSAGVVAGLALFATSGLWLLRREPLLVSLAALPAMIGAASLLALGRNLWPRFFFHEAGFVALGLAHATLGIGAWIAARMPPPYGRALSLLPITLLVLAAASGLPRSVALPKQDYPGARDFVLALATPGDRIVPLDQAAEVYRRYYAPEWDGARNEAELRARLSPAGRTFVLYTLPRYLDATQPALMAWLERDFVPLRTFAGSVGDGAIVVRVREPTPARPDTAGNASDAAGNGREGTTWRPEPRSP